MAERIEQLALAWVDEPLPILMADQFGTQIAPGHCVLTIGQAVPPLLVDAETSIPVQPLMRVALSREAFEQLRSLLDRAAAQWDERSSAPGGEGRTEAG